ncbi:hypothetical protein HXX76_012563 [Chlamydomonas incerta]|uniref:Pherophorin domain-containing protein n=1 Tax=Chlamydomonas incerta TaxID=51695 RepID=A0A835VRZ2_CHLIN|nr:hypothetical protein HXX76_012563 [Chlamydomonas incerta]|eukprot:KAG2427047.1 hypothetical protein HXX76_012563 [Chlamydomonas incerta]
MAQHPRLLSALAALFLVASIFSVADACNPFTLETSIAGRRLGENGAVSGYTRVTAARRRAQAAPCTCVPEDSVCDCSPYRLSEPVVTDLDPDIDLTTGSRFCFTLEVVGCGPNPLPCCTDLAALPLQQVLISVANGCSGRFVDFSLNGEFYPDASVDGPYSKSSQVIFRNLDLDLESAAGTEFCVATTDEAGAGPACSTVPQLCDDPTGNCKYLFRESDSAEVCPTCGTVPPPPPSPVPKILKTHNCRTDTGADQPFVLGPLTRVASSGTSAQAWSTYCVTVSTRDAASPSGCPAAEAASAAGHCCGMTMDKLEFIVAPSCRFKITKLKVNGRPRATSTSHYPQFDAASFKWTALGLTPAQAASTTFCFTAVGSCADLSALALQGRVQASIFDASRSECCPTFSLPDGGRRRARHA